MAFDLSLVPTGLRDLLVKVRDYTPEDWARETLHWHPAIKGAAVFSRKKGQKYRERQLQKDPHTIRRLWELCGDPMATAVMVMEDEVLDRILPTLESEILERCGYIPKTLKN
jgi:hypothetical protein